MLAEACVWDPGGRDAADRPAGGARDRSNRSGAGRDGRGGNDVAHASPGLLVLGGPDAVGRVWASWRRSGMRNAGGGRARLAALSLAGVSAASAGWFWTIGHIAGPVAAVYLWVDGRRRCRWAAAIPLAATVLAVALGLALGGRQASIARSASTAAHPPEAARPVQGFCTRRRRSRRISSSATWVCRPRRRRSQGLILTLVLLGAWGRQCGGDKAELRTPSTRWNAPGLALVLGSYLVEWTFRGYLPFRYLRTINLGMIVPWYDAIPHIGAVLFIAGGSAGPQRADARHSLGHSPAGVTRLGAVGLAGL